MTSAPCVCEQCGARMWPLGLQKRCRTCRFAYTPKRVGRADLQRVRVEEEEVAIGERLMLADDRARHDKTARLAAIRAAQTARQRRFMGLPA